MFVWFYINYHFEHYIYQSVLDILNLTVNHSSLLIWKLNSFLDSHTLHPMYLFNRYIFSSKYNTLHPAPAVASWTQKPKLLKPNICRLPEQPNLIQIKVNMKCLLGVKCFGFIYVGEKRNEWEMRLNLF